MARHTPFHVVSILSALIPLLVGGGDFVTALSSSSNLDCQWWTHDHCTKSADNTITLKTNASLMGAAYGDTLFKYGWFEAQLKLSYGDLSGAATAFYLINDGVHSNTDYNHFEIDIEFFGANSSKNTLLAINVFLGGRQNLAQFQLPFDPADSFNTYTIGWSRTQIVFQVNKKTIRVINWQDDAHWPLVPMRPMFTQWHYDFNPDAHTPYFTNGPISAFGRGFSFIGCNSTCPDFLANSPDTWTPGYDTTGLSSTSYGFADNSSRVNDWGWEDLKKN